MKYSSYNSVLCLTDTSFKILCTVFRNTAFTMLFTALQSRVFTTLCTLLLSTPFRGLCTAVCLSSLSVEDLISYWKFYKLE